MIILVFIPPPAHWEHHFFPALFSYQHILTSFILGDGNSPDGAKSQGSAHTHSTSAAPTLPWGSGSWQGTGTALAHLTSTVPGAGQGERSKKWCCSFSPEHHQKLFAVVTGHQAQQEANFTLKSSFLQKS